jgi:NADH dehydrogenase
MESRNHHKRVIIIGAGFGGLWAARHLARAHADVLVISRENYHTFFPLLYQVAAAELEPGEISHPVRSILQTYKNADYLLDEVTGIDLEKKIVHTGGHKLSYDYLVIASGSKPHYFDIEGAAEHAFALRTMEDGIRLRNHILTCFEKASREENPDKRKKLLSFAVVGGGATGVEFAGALAELIKKPLRRDFPNLDFGEVRITLFEAMDHLMTAFSPKLRQYTVRRLSKIGVDVQTGKTVSEVTGDALVLKDGTRLETATVVWTAGVSGNPMPELSLLKNQQVEVLPTLQLKGSPEVYVIGDLARVVQDGQPLQMIATVAIQEGTWAGKNIRRQLAGKEPETFVYHDPGTMATIGRNAAICHIWGMELTGFPAWAFWLGVHIVKLIGFRNRLQILISWLWEYLFYERAVRLILPGEN